MGNIRCYTIDQVREKLQMSRATFDRLRKSGRLPCVEELQPRLGGRPRFRADLVDRYLDNQFQQPRQFFKRVK
jgi:predicted DNA-binding transcriptional regulator AlpA